MRYTAKQYAQALMEALERSGPNDTNQILDNFAKTLAENNDTRQFESIAEEFHKLELEKKGMKLAEVTTAREMNHETEKQVIETLNRVMKTDVELKKKVDAGLIGGCVIRVEDTVIDASIRNSLEELRNKLAE